MNKKEATACKITTELEDLSRSTRCWNPAAGVTEAQERKRIP